MNEAEAADEPTPSPSARTDEQLAAWIVDQMDKAADLAEVMPMSQHLLATYIAHMNEEGFSVVPPSLLNWEYLRGFIELEARILRLERILRDHNIDVPLPPSIT